MLYKKIIAVVLLFGTGMYLHEIVLSTSSPFSAEASPALAAMPETILLDATSTQILPELLPIEKTVHRKSPAVTQSKNSNKVSSTDTTKEAADTENTAGVFSVPFYSQFTDITSPEWKKVGCGIASLAMLIEFHKPGSVSVDTLLKEGIAADAYLSNAGWTYAGLIGISKKYGLTGKSNDMAGSSMDTAFTKLKTILKDGPVMVSVHYTFDPRNPIPHLVIVNGVRDGLVYYNDPAEKAGGGSITIAKFQSSWKKRYIEMYPIT